MEISEILETQYKPFCHYVIESRAIPKITDGLKPVQRRSLWSGKKVAKEFAKVAKLAGTTMSNHPHGNTSIEATISCMAQDFTGANNVCFFEGKGQFGKRINGPGKGFASARYVAVRLSENFYRMLDQDSDLINMIPNYDETDKEPESFLPLIPTVLLNPCQGIAVGFACNILPRDLDEVKKCQIAYLQGKSIDRKKLLPSYKGFTGTIEKGETPEQYVCTGVFSRRSSNIIEITDLPIGMNREQYVSVLDKLEDADYITSYQDNCKGNFAFTVRLKKPVDDDEEIIKKFKLRANLNENITLIGFDGQSVIERAKDVDIIKQFTDWRFGFYLERFKRDLDNTNDELEFKKALLLVITKGLFKKFPNQTRKEIISDLQGHKIADQHINRILGIAIYRFGKDEVVKLREEIKKLEAEKKELTVLVKSKDKRTEVYIQELRGCHV